MTGLLSCSNLSVDYGSVSALQGVNLEFGAKGVTGLVGVNGAGKTTLIHALIGLIPGAGGKVSIASSHGALGYCPDAPAFEPWLEASEVLAQSVVLAGNRPPQANLTRRTLARVGLSEVGSRRVGGFSRGMTQRLGIAAALILEPQLLFLDEPTSALDPLGRDEMLELVGTLGTELHVVFSSHLLADVHRVADSLVVLHRGSVRYSGPVSSFLAGSDSDIRIDTTGDAAEIVARFRSAGILATVDIEAGSVEVPRSYQKALFVALSEDATDVVGVSLQRASLQTAFRAEIQRSSTAIVRHHA